MLEKGETWTANFAPATQPRTNRSKSWKWIPLVVIAILGLHAWSHCSSELDSHREPFSAIPGGGPGDIVVTPCGKGLECGYINVPKDYFNASAGVANIAFARVKALKQPAKGSVMINPGGPGGSGVALASWGGPLIRQLLGDDWDFIGFDPRGIGLTRPQTKCFDSALSHQLFWSNTVFEQTYTLPNIANTSDPLNRLFLTEQARQILALQEAQVKSCYEHMDVEDLKYMGTATVVRDIDFMTQVLDGKDAKINYWGGSYGTILGAYLVNMLPHRIAYATIDGVADPISWSNNPSFHWARDWTSSAEKAYEWFLRDCSEAGPALCPIAKHRNEKPSAILDRIENFLQDLVERPLVGTYAGRPGYVTSGAARGAIFVGLEGPRLQPYVARALAEAMENRNATRLLSLILTPLGTTPGHSGGDDLARLGVTCADSPYKPAPTAEDIADELLAGLEKSSPHFGASPIYSEPDGGCQFWPTQGRTPERFTGPWNASLSYPMLIVTTTADPITPIKTALRLNKQMHDSSTLLIQNGPGHCSVQLPSICTIKAIREYWAGNPPKNGTWCEVTTKAFPNATDSASTLSTKDQELLNAASEFGKIMHGIVNPKSRNWM